jgi:glucose dehydrogenase
MTKTWLALGAVAFSALHIDAAIAQRNSSFSARALTAPPTDGWRTNGGNLFNQRYSPLSRIDRANVAQVKGVWRTHLNGSGVAPQFSGEAQPIVHDGVIYVITGADDVFALSVDTGEILWRYLAKLDPSITSICCGWTSRGVGIGEGKIFAGLLDGRVVALDERTGEQQWSIQAERWQEGFSITSAPLYYDGMVITGFSGAEIGVRGRVKAYDADDGKLLWTFYTIPGPGELGHDTWPQDNEVWKHGGMADAGRRSGARAPLFLDGQSRSRFQRRRARRRQPVLGVDRRARGAHGEISLALPGSPSRHLGLRRAESRRSV